MKIPPPAAPYAPTLSYLLGNYFLGTPEGVGAPAPFGGQPRRVFQPSPICLQPVSTSAGAVASEGPAYPGVKVLCERYLSEYSPNEIYWLAAVFIDEDPRFANGVVELPPPAHPPLPERQRQLLENNKLCSKLTQDLVGLLWHPESELVLTDIPFRQRCGHIDAGPSGRPTLINDVTLSSVAIKKDYKPGNQHMLRFNANLARIQAGARTVCGRSSRSDSPQKLEELLEFNALSSLDAAGGDPTRATGFHVNKATGEATFELTLITAMDRSILKGLFTSITGGEDERTFIANLENSIEVLFGDEPQITRQLTLNGAPVKVCFQRPALLNITLSGQSKRTANLTRHRNSNRPALNQLVKKLCATWSQSGGSEKNIARLILDGQDRDHLGSAGFWTQAPVLISRRNLNPKQALVVELIQHIYTGNTSDGDRLEEATSPGVEFLLISYLLDETNQALTVQCKSGQDRTLTLVSLQVAATAFFQEFGYAFNPLLPKSDPDAVRFREIFTDAANTFGEPMIKAVRGHNAHHGIAKWASHPTPLYWYNADQDSQYPIGRF